MAAVFTEIATFIFLLARTCCVQGETPTGMFIDHTCMPFVQCSATVTTEFALTISMEEAVNNVLLIQYSIAATTNTCSVYNNFSLCAIHDTSDRRKTFTVKTFFPSDLPRYASQFECTVTRLYTSYAKPNITTYPVNVTFESTTSTLAFTNPSTLSTSSAKENGSVTPLPEHDCPKDHIVTVIVLAVLLAIFILISLIFITTILIRRSNGNSDKQKEINLKLSTTAPPNKYENVKDTKNNDMSASSKTKSPSLKPVVDVDDNGYASTTGSSASINANPGYSEPWNSDRLPIKPSPSLVRIKGFERKDNDLVKTSPGLVRIEECERKDNDPVKPNPGLVHHEGYERKDNDHVDEQEICTESTPTKF